MNLDPSVASDIADRLSALYHPRKIILFGSYAQGTPRADSDIDLMVLVDTPPRSRRQAIVAGRMALGNIRKPFDLLIKTTAEFDRMKAVRASLEHQVDRFGIVLYEQ